MDTLRALLEFEDDHINLVEALDEAINAVKQTKPRFIKPAIKGAKDLFTKNPGLTIAAAAVAVDAYDKYRRNKRNTISLFAKDAFEKRMMKDVVDSLTQSGKFKLKHTKYAHGGQYWVLKRVQ